MLLGADDGDIGQLHAGAQEHQVEASANVGAEGPAIGAGVVGVVDPVEARVALQEEDLGVETGSHPDAQGPGVWGAQREVIVDVCGLEQPEPLLRALAALEGLASGGDAEAPDR